MFFKISSTPICVSKSWERFAEKKKHRCMHTEFIIVGMHLVKFPNVHLHAYIIKSEIKIGSCRLTCENNKSCGGGARSQEFRHFNIERASLITAVYIRL
jgi:hypothetical protein